MRGVKLVQLKVEFNESPLRRVSDVQRVANFGETSFIPLRRVRNVQPANFSARGACQSYALQRRYSASSRLRTYLRSYSDLIAAKLFRNCSAIHRPGLASVIGETPCFGVAKSFRNLRRLVRSYSDK